MEITEKEYLEALEVVKKYNKHLDWVDVKHLEYKHDADYANELCTVAPVFTEGSCYLQLISPLGYVIPSGLSLSIKDGIGEPLTATVELNVKLGGKTYVK